MKYLPAIALLSAVAISNYARTQEHIKEDIQKKHEELKKRDMKAIYAVYKANKESCLKENKEFKGKKLQECIIGKNK